MPIITLPDGSQRNCAQPLTVMELAQSIGPGLARATVAAELDGELVDACELLERDCTLRLITPRDPEGLEIIRHSCAHMLGQAVKQLYPQAQMVIGPVIEDGFYYDIDSPEPFGPDDLEALQQRMQNLIDAEYDVIKTMTQREKVMEIFRERGENYKMQLVAEMDESVRELGLYHHQEYVDMCRGPHVPNTRFLKVFQLTHLAGAYWRGDASKQMLQRVYGTAWETHKQLQEWSHRREEAQRRDHRRLGKRLDLFHFREESPGMVFWHPHGWTLFGLVEAHLRAAVAEDYQEVHTPQLLDRSLWELSGHWDKFGDMIFTTESEKREYAVKPMNCPGHVQIFKQRLRSYHELPLRLTEFGVVHRNEPSGTLHGLLRARRFTQDDGHIFCMPTQLGEELERFFDLVFKVYGDFGFDQVELALSTRPSQRVGSDEQWDQAERELEQALQRRGLEYKLQPGEGAFYGPKIEFTLGDSIGRSWQCGTAQVDFSMPERLGAHYIGDDSARHAPVLLHRAVLGSLERFIGILIEHHAGDLPLWLAPVQVAVLNITDRQAEYVQQLVAGLRAKGLRPVADLRNEKIGYKIREATLQRVPYMLIVGDREQNQDTVAVRTRAGEDLGAMALPAFVDHLPERYPPSEV